MSSFEKTSIVICIIALLVCPLDTRAQRIYVADNATQSVNPGVNVKVFENGSHKYIIAVAQGVTLSPRAVGFDSTGGIYVIKGGGGGVQKLVKYTESDDGSEVFAHTQFLSAEGGVGGYGTCRWALGGSRQIDVDLNDDTVVVANTSGAWNTSCPSPGGRSGSYGYIIRYEGADPTLLPGVELLGSHTVAIGIQGLALINKTGARTPQGSVMTIDQVNGDVYVGSTWNTIDDSTQALERFSRDFVQLDFWDVNDPARGVPGNVTNLMLGGLAVTSDGSVWFNDVTGGAGMGGWGFMGSIVKFDSSGQFVTRRSGSTVMSGTSRNDFTWTGGMDVDEHDVLYYAETDRIITLSSDNGDFMGFPVGDTTGQSDTNVYGEGAFTSNPGSLEQIAVGPEPAVGSSLRIF
jgi:hypothetical protein